MKAISFKYRGIGELKIMYRFFHFYLICSMLATWSSIITACDIRFSVQYFTDITENQIFMILELLRRKV